MKPAFVTLVCFFVGLLSVLAVSSHPMASIVAAGVCIAAYPSVARFAKMLAPVVEAWRERRATRRTFVDCMTNLFNRCACRTPSVFTTSTGARVCVVCRMQERSDSEPLQYQIASKRAETSPEDDHAKSKETVSLGR